MNKLIKAVAIATVAALIPAANAATTTSNFNVTVNLTPVCTVTSAPTDVAFTYTSFQAAAAASTGGNFTVRCTNTLGYAFSLDATPSTLIGLNYALTLPTATAGTGAAQNYQITGSMAAGQSGTCAGPASCAASHVRTLTVTF